MDSSHTVLPRFPANAMTPDEEKLLRDIGVLLLGNLAGFTAMTLLYGVFVLLFSISTYKITHRKLKFRPAMAMFMVSLITFILATLYWCAYLASFATQVRGILVDTDIGPLDTGSFDGIYKKGLPFTHIENWTAQLVPMISDGVVIWRAWVLYDDQRWILIGPIALLVGTVGSGIGFLGLATHEASNVAASSQSLTVVGGLIGTIARKNTFLSFSALSLATNVFAAVLILYRLWSHGQPAGSFPVGQKGQMPSRFQTVAVLLVESGVLYAATQVINLVLELIRTTPDSSLYFGERVITAVYTLCTAMYPTIAVMLVVTQRSITNIFGFVIAVQTKPGANVASASGRPATIGHLSFAAPPTQISGHTASTFNTESHVVSIVQLDVQSEKGREINDDGEVNEKQTKTVTF